MTAPLGESCRATEAAHAPIAWDERWEHRRNRGGRTLPQEMTEMLAPILRDMQIDPTATFDEAYDIHRASNLGYGAILLCLSLWMRAGFSPRYGLDKLWGQTQHAMPRR